MYTWSWNAVGSWLLRGQVPSYQQLKTYPLVIEQYAIENDHRNSEFSHETKIIVMLNYGRVYNENEQETSNNKAERCL